jgi:hypothetical protein
MNGSSLKAIFLAVFVLSLGCFSCGLKLKGVLVDEGEVPLELQKVDFSRKQRALDLIEDSFGNSGLLLGEYGRCNPSNSQTSQHVAAFLEAQSKHVMLLRGLGTLPSNLPIFPSPENLQKALVEFKASGRKVTPRERTFESNANDSLVQKFIGKKESLNEKELSALALKLNKQKETLVKFGNSRWYYAFSLEPDNEFQWLVKCSQVGLQLKDGTLTNLIWPIFNAIESNSLKPNGALKTSLRTDLNVEIGNGFSLQTPEVSSTQVERSVGRLGYRLNWNSLWGRHFSLYFRESDFLFFSRFFTQFLNKESSPNAELAQRPVNSVETTASSFQLTGTKSNFESSTSFSKETKSTFGYRNLTCNPVTIADDKAFQSGGLHYLDQKTVESSVAALASASETIPLEEGQKLCQALYALDK